MTSPAAPPSSPLRCVRVCVVSVLLITWMAHSQVRELSSKGKRRRSAQARLGLLQRYAVIEHIAADSLRAGIGTHLECATGDGVEKDESKAGEWWHKASAQGHAAAQCDLGWAYDNGRGVPKDSAKAVELYDPYMSVRQAS